MEKKITGATSYKGLTAQQHDDAIKIFENFLTEIRPSRVLEIGTAGGGFILAIRDILNNIGLESSPIKTFDVYECNWYNVLRENNIEVNIENIFDHSYFNLEKPERIVPFIQEEGTTLVLCDGGFKIGEFNSITPYLKVGDFIMAHDYSSDLNYFNEHINNKIWNWCEIKDSDIDEVSNFHNLIKYDSETFQKVVWTCRKKIK